MKIYINDQLLDTTLEKEENLKEVYDSMEKWVESQGKFIVNCLVDGTEVDPSGLSHMKIESAERFDFLVGEDLDMVIASLAELDKYIDNIGNTLFGRDSLTNREAVDLEEGVSWMESILSSSRKLLKLDYKKIQPYGSEKTMEDVIAICTSKVSNLNTVSSIENYLDNLRDMKLFVMDLLNRISLLHTDMETLKQIVKTYANNMELLKKEFIRVNENFQSGKDYLATELLNHSIGRLHILVSGLVSLASHSELQISQMEINGETLIGTNTLLNEKLSTVENALANKDIVTAGDILEYELPEVLGKFVPFLQEIERKLEKK